MGLIFSCLLFSNGKSRKTQQSISPSQSDKHSNDSSVWYGELSQFSDWWMMMLVSPVLCCHQYTLRSMHHLSHGLVAGERRLCTIMSAILNYLRFKIPCDDDFNMLKSRMVIECYVKCLCDRLVIDTSACNWRAAEGGVLVLMSRSCIYENCFLQPHVHFNNFSIILALFHWQFLLGVL